MNLLKWLVKLIGYLLRTLTFGWLVDLAGLLRGFWKFWRAACARHKLPHPQREPSTCCIRTTHPSVHRPDPCIYSQAYLMQQGLPVTWDNPDIVLRRGGVIVSEHDLLPNTTYDVEATIWNNSYDGPAVGLKVDFSFLSFGIATVSTPIGSATTNVGVKGSALQPARVTVPWTTPATPGHFCIQVLLSGTDDSNPNNNLGQNNVDVVAAASPAHFSFPLRNPFAKAMRFRIEVDTYRLPDPEPCGPKPQRGESRTERIRRIDARHRAGGVGIPPGWNVLINPREITLDPGAEVSIDVTVTPPDDFHGSKNFNFAAWAEGATAGGVTVVVTRA